MDKKTPLWQHVLAIIIGCCILLGLLFYMHGAKSAEPVSSVEVNVKQLPEYKIQQLLEVKKESLGIPMGEVKDNQLVINYSPVKEGSAFYEFKVKNSNERVVLYCQKDLNAVDIGYEFKLFNDSVEELADGFSIQVIPAGNKKIHWVDGARPAIFDTHQGDNYLKAALDNLVDEDQEAYITFAIRYSDSQDNSIIGGYSPTFKIKDVVAGLKQIPTDACDFVQLADVPSKM